VVAALLLNEGLMHLLVEGAMIDYLQAKFLIVAVAMFFNYPAKKSLLFRRPSCSNEPCGTNLDGGSKWSRGGA
jgi:putative flippase GtrA